MNFGCENHKVFWSDCGESSEKNNSVSESSWDDDGSDRWRRACCCASALSRKGLKPSCRVKYPNAKAPITTTPDLIAFILAVSFILSPSLLTSPLSLFWKFSSLSCRWLLHLNPLIFILHYCTPHFTEFTKKEHYLLCFIFQENKIKHIVRDNSI